MSVVCISTSTFNHPTANNIRFEWTSVNSSNKNIQIESLYAESREKQRAVREERNKKKSQCWCRCRCWRCLGWWMRCVFVCEFYASHAWLDFTPNSEKKEEKNQHPNETHVRDVKMSDSCRCIGLHIRNVYFHATLRAPIFKPSIVYRDLCFVCSIDVIGVYCAVLLCYDAVRRRFREA